MQYGSRSGSRRYNVPDGYRSEAKSGAYSNSPVPHGYAPNSIPSMNPPQQMPPAASPPIARIQSRSGSGPQHATQDVEVIKMKLESVLSDKSKFIKSARGSFKQFDFDGNGSLSFEECRALLNRLIQNLQLPPLDDNTLRAIYSRFNSGSENGEMSSEDFCMMFWRILWRVRDKYYPTRNIRVKRADLVGRTAINPNEIKRLFDFGRRLGGGSFGEAFLVVEKSSGLQRCCKIINKDKAMVSIDQINAEVTVLKSLDHPNVIKILDVYEDYNNLYILQDVCEGDVLLRRLEGAIQRGKILTEKYVKEVMRQLFEALAYIHDKNVVHKDLKPDNIMYARPDPHSPIKVIDFGLSEMFQAADETSQIRAGTILYMAPEVLTAMVTLKSDLWSAGCVMFQMLTGRVPFMGRTKNEIMNKIKSGEPNYDHCRHVSREALQLVQALLLKNPCTRPSARQALEHDWFRSIAVDSVLLDTDICANLAAFSRHSNLKAALINLMTHQLSFNSGQIKRLTDAFKSMDKDNSGTLSRGELSVALGKAGLEPWEINKIVQALDVDGSGDISYTEFLAAAYTWREGELNIIWTAFAKLDRDRNGRISVDEFAELLNGGNTGSKLLDQCDMTDMIKSLDANGDGQIDWDEFLQYMVGTGTR